MNNLDINYVLGVSMTQMEKIEACQAINHICRRVDWTEKHVKLSIKIFFENPETSLFFKEGEQVIGYAIMRPLAERVHYISFIAIDPHYQGRGIGKELLMMMLNLARVNGIVRVTLDHDDTGQLNQFYDSIPFEKISEINGSCRGIDQKYVTYFLPEMD